MAKLSFLQIGQLHAHALERIGETAPEEDERFLDAFGLDPVRAELLRESRVEAEQGLVRDRATQACVDSSVDALGIDQPLEEPDRRAVSKALELRDAERRPCPQVGEDLWVREPGRALECAQGTRQPAIPAVCQRDRLRGRPVGGGAERDGA